MADGALTRQLSWRRGRRGRLVWVGDHLNSLFPRSIATRRYVGAARLVPKVDAVLEPWTVLGHLAARNRIGRLRLVIYR